MMQEQLQLLRNRLQAATLFAVRKKQEYETLCIQVSAVESDIKQAKELDIHLIKVQKFFHTIGSEEQEKLQKWMEQIVTYGLQAVFGKYQFQITAPEIRAGEVAIGFRVLSDGEERDPYSEMGGGVVDVLSFLLQFVLVFLLRDRIQPVLFLDESFKHVSPDRRSKMAALLRELCDRTNVQIVLITHADVYEAVADVVYGFERDYLTSVERLK